MLEALCRQSSTTLDIVHAEDGPPITQRTRALKTFDEILRLKPEDEFEVYADGCLRREMIDRFKSKFSAPQIQLHRG
jgi:hypothetical protein